MKSRILMFFTQCKSSEFLIYLLSLNTWFLILLQEVFPKFRRRGRGGPSELIRVFFFMHHLRQVPSVQLHVKSQQKICWNNIKSGEKTTVKDIFSVNHQALRAFTVVFSPLLILFQHIFSWPWTSNCTLGREEKEEAVV